MQEEGQIDKLPLSDIVHSLTCMGDKTSEISTVALDS